MRWPESAPLLTWALACMAAVAAHAGQAYDELYRHYPLVQPLHPGNLAVCYDHGCESVRRIDLDDAHWETVTSPLAQAAADPAAEREQLRRAVAAFERVVGRLAGTADDRGGDLATFRTLRPQLDCVDESINTTTYLTLLEDAGLLRWHSVEPRARRGYLLFGGFFHYSAVIREHATGQRWAVDSWFRDNGEPPDVIAFEVWQDGWSPPGFVL